MRPALVAVSLLFVAGAVCAQTTAPKPVAKAAAPQSGQMRLPAATPPPGDMAMPTPEQLAELACANEYAFFADKVGENRFLLRLDTQSPQCRKAGRAVQWKVSGDEGLTFVELAPGGFVRSVKPVAQGVEVEVIPDLRFYALGSVTIMDGVNADGPVLAFGASELDMLQAVSAAAPARAAK